MAASKRPSFLKRQKEQQRTARASEKREARRLRKRGGTAAMQEAGESDVAGDELQGTEEAIPNDANDTDDIA